MEKIEEKNWTLDVQCIGGFHRSEVPCGGSFQITEDDLEVRTSIVMMEAHVNVIGFVCKDCGTYTEIRMDEIPVVIKNRVLAKHHNEKKEERKRKVDGLKQRFEPVLKRIEDLKAQIFK